MRAMKVRINWLKAVFFTSIAVWIISLIVFLRTFFDEDVEEEVFGEVLMTLVNATGIMVLAGLGGIAGIVYVWRNWPRLGIGSKVGYLLPSIVMLGLSLYAILHVAIHW